MPAACGTLFVGRPGFWFPPSPSPAAASAFRLRRRFRVFAFLVPVFDPRRFPPFPFKEPGLFKFYAVAPQNEPDRLFQFNPGGIHGEDKAAGVKKNRPAVFPASLFKGVPGRACFKVIPYQGGQGRGASSGVLRSGNAFHPGKPRQVGAAEAGVFP